MTHDEGQRHPDIEHGGNFCYAAIAAQPVTHDDPTGGEFPLPDDHQGGRAAQCVHFVMAKILKSHNKEASPGKIPGAGFSHFGGMT